MRTWRRASQHNLQREALTIFVRFPNGLAENASQPLAPRTGFDSELDTTPLTWRCPAGVGTNTYPTNCSPPRTPENSRFPPSAFSPPPPMSCISTLPLCGECASSRATATRFKMTSSFFDPGMKVRRMVSLSRKAIND